ncbi:pericentriolar material 1 protein [Gossypium australe]|uniref:Pericentriolar material 1 protein n=1 Tax=Gossypium australe TaxID=47621 RepID=A0A5B6UNH6_9ROSI|nr:pericentriolar material 1 protein [Gossypium australe]
MDSWFVAVAAAAAAGYFAKYWRNLTTDRNGFPKVSSVDSGIGKAVTGKDLVHKFAMIRKLREDVSDRKISDVYGLNVASAAEIGSASGFNSEKIGSSGSLSPGLLTNENLRENQCGKELSADCGSGSAKASIARIDSFNEPMHKRSSLKAKYSYGRSLKPLSSLDSCLMAQLHMQHVKMEEYVLSCLPSPTTPILRPLLITDGSRIINRASGDFSTGSNGIGDSKLHNLATFEKNRYVHAVSPLPKIDSSDLPEKLKFKSGNECDGRPSIPCKINTEKQFHAQWGTGLALFFQFCFTYYIDTIRICRHDRAVLFCLGISIGIICSYIGNRREVEKLRGLLKQTENLVQDLQEELEMKDSLTVKELANENYESQEACDNSFPDRAMNSSSLEQKTDNLTRFVGKESHHQKVEESPESMSKIEAELEAELERLGLNMNVLNLEQRLPDLGEIDPNFVADFAEGELRSDMVTGQAHGQSMSNENRSGTSTTHSGNYAVSPRELTLRLHEVIQSRLEERVQELETALENSQRKVKLMESEHKNPNNKWKYSTMESPMVNEDPHRTSKPQVPKLSWETPDHAYNEAFEGAKEEGTPLRIYREKLAWDDQYDANKSDETFYDQVRISEDQSSRVQELLDVDVREDECSDNDDEMEKLLIQQIVEKTKKGSPVLLNAQRLLFSMDEI